jgi:phosphatidylinositol alpha-mannosyltransferase
MRIGIVCPYNIFKAGGVQQHVMHQTQILRTRGYDVTIITPRPYRITEIPPTGTVFLGASARVKSPQATSADVSVASDADVVDMLAKHRFDIIHIHEPLVPFLARQILQKTTCPIVGTFHAALPGNALGKSLTGSYRAYARTVLPNINAITAVSPAAIGYIDEANSLPINYIPNGVELKIYKHDKKVQRDQDTILFVGRLEKRKGAKYAIKAFELVKAQRPEVQLLIAGDGPLRRSLENYVNLRKIPDVYFLGFVSDEEKKLLFQKATVYTSPALYGESFGIVLVEAMALGTPIVAHSSEGYSWVLKETGRLSLVDVENIPDYARRLLLMMEDKALREVWQKWASSYVQQFSYDKVVDAYEKVYKGLT